MKTIKYWIIIILSLFSFACGKDDGGADNTLLDPCSELGQNCSELTAEDFEMLCNAQNLTLELTTSNDNNAFECKYTIRDSEAELQDQLVFKLYLSRSSNCEDPQERLDFNKEFISPWDKFLLIT